MNKSLKRYWFILSKTDKFGLRNIGVSALSVSRAKLIILENLHLLTFFRIVSSDIDEAEVIENIDVRFLDPNHVIPNMGSVIFQGIWFPQLNI